MAKSKILALDAIRGISMLGVVGIHTGSHSLSNPHVNLHLFALLEIVSRFSVPIFFFVSAFGLFWGQPLQGAFDYGRFYWRRIRTVVIPYILWSFFYMWHYTFISGDRSIWTLRELAEFFFFGLGSYHLYFLVILIWFYAAMPLWRWIIGRVQNRPVLFLALLFLLQTAFNYYSSYVLHPSTTSGYLYKALSYRLSYWPFHYLFIFFLGALCAVHYERFQAFCQQRLSWLSTGAIVSLGAILGHYYYVIYQLHYSAEAAVNTVHQLSPSGMVYTLGMTLWLFAYFNQPGLPAFITRAVSFLSKHSYMVYLIHPLMMYYLNEGYEKTGILMSAVMTLLFYGIVVGLSISASIALRRLPRFHALITGSAAPPARTKSS